MAKSKNKLKDQFDDEMFATVYVPVGRGKEMRYVKTRKPKHLVEKRTFWLDHPEFKKPEEIEGSIETAEREMEEYKKFLASVNDHAMCENLLKVEPSEVKKKLINERIKELKNGSN